MKHHRHPPVPISRRLPILLVLLVALVAVSGCSVFGIATKAELEKVDREAAADRDQVHANVVDMQDRLDGVDREVDALEAGLARRMTSLEDSVTTLETDLASARGDVEILVRKLEITRGLLGELDQNLVAALDTVGGRVDAVGDEVASVRRYASRVDQQAQSARIAAETATLRSEEAWQAYFTSLVEERDRLEQRLRDLTGKIERLQQRELQRRDEVPAEALPGGIRPERPEGDDISRARGSGAANGTDRSITG